MNVVAIYKNTIFILPNNADGSIVIAELKSYDIEDLDQKLMCETYNKAHEKAHLHIMSKDDYNNLYP